MPRVVVGPPLHLARPHRQERLGPIERLDLALLVHHSTSARSGGWRYKPTMSRTFSMKSGSADSLKVSTRWGCSAKARQMRCTALRLSPLACAIDRVLQCVASAGVVSRVRVSTRSTCASVIVRGAPGRGSSRSPSSRRRRNRVRHLPTVCLVTGISWATRHSSCPRHSPGPDARAARRPCGRRPARPALQVSRSDGVKSNGGIGRPCASVISLPYRERRARSSCFTFFRDRTLVRTRLGTAPSQPFFAVCLHRCGPLSCSHTRPVPRGSQVGGPVECSPEPCPSQPPDDRDSPR